MSDGTSIEWTDASWSPVTGCTRVSAGCDHCYIDRTPPFRMNNRRFSGPGTGATTGVKLHSDRLCQPQRWRKPRRIFVCSLADLFQDEVPDRFIAEVFAVMSVATQHTYQVLTKRHARLRLLLNSEAFWVLVDDARAARRYGPLAGPPGGVTLPNVWLGVSVENQQWADIRIPALLETPAAVRWISAEPLLGPVDLSRWLTYGCPQCERRGPWTNGRSVRAGDRVDEYWCQTCGAEVPLAACVPPGLSWIVCGGESGPGARPMHPDWARGLRDACTSASVPFFFKQWGEWGPAPWRLDRGPDESVEAYKARAEALCATHAYAVWADRYGHEPYQPPHRPWSSERVELSGGDHAPMRRWGKKAAGRLLDGRTWDEYPEPSREVSGV